MAMSSLSSIGKHPRRAKPTGRGSRARFFNDEQTQITRSKKYDKTSIRFEVMEREIMVLYIEVHDCIFFSRLCAREELVA